MSDLREQLLKMGLIQPEAAEKASARELKTRHAPTRGQDEKALYQPPVPRQLSPEEGQSIAKLGEEGRWKGKIRGHRRWYYISRKDKAVPFLELSDEAVQGLEREELAICENTKGEAWLVEQTFARKIAAIDPGWIRS